MYIVPPYAAIVRQHASVTGSMKTNRGSSVKRAVAPVGDGFFVFPVEAGKANVR
jgi:hypothetical protein